MYASINIKREDFSKAPETSTAWFIEFHVKYFDYMKMQNPTAWVWKFLYINEHKNDYKLLEYQDSMLIM